MKKELLIGAALFLASTSAFAGGYLTNTNQHIAFLRMCARGASTEIDAVYSNPAGLAFMNKEGFTLSLNIQSAAQNRNIDARYTFPVLDLGTGTPLGTETYSGYYKGEASAPVVPSFFAAWKKGDWAISGSFAVVGGGGKASFDKGLPMFDSAVRFGLANNKQMRGLQQLAKVDRVSDLYDLNTAMDGSQFIYGVQLGVTYKIADWISVFGGGRMNYFSGGYEGYLDAVLKQPYADAFGMTGDKQNLYRIALDCDQTGWGVTPILGADVRYRNFTLGMKYEFMTSLNLENKTHQNSDPNGALADFADGVNTPSDIPALFTAALRYDFLPTLRATVEYHRFFDKSAGMANDKQKALTRGTNEYLAGIEWDAHKYVTVSAGYQNTDYGLGDDFQSDTSFSCDSYSIGLGAALNISSHLKLNIAYFWSTYSDYTKNYKGYSQAISGTNVYSRTNKVFGVGVDYSF